MKQEWGIKSRVLFLTLVPTIIISLLLSAYFTGTRIKDLEKSLRDHGYTIALQLAPASEYGVFSGNTATLQRLANETLSEQDVRSVMIFNKDGRLLVHAGYENKNPLNILSIQEQSHGIAMADTGNSLIFTVPVSIHDVITEDYAYADAPTDLRSDQDTVLGWISIELGRMNTTLRQYQVLFTCSIIVLIGLGISGIFAFRMGRDVTRPILQMAAAVEKIKNGNLDTRIYTNARSELRHLEAGINTMASSLKAAHDEMQQNVEQATADLRQTLEMIEIQNIELEMARKEAETASKIKSEFLANMSHEIRTPLNGVVGFINLLVKTKLTPRQSDYLSTIQSSSTNLLSIINDILDFSKIEAGKLTLDQAPMDIRECVEDALMLMAPNAHEKGLELIPMIYSDVPEKIIGDHLRLKQIITNLVNNAIKFTQEGSVVVRIMLENNMEDKVMLCGSVTDSGIGLSPDVHKTLFQPFSQADASTTRKFGGTGLGLVISKRLVEQMQGEIGVESDLGNGATFWFTFVVKKVDEPATKIHYHPKLKELRILVYEENPTMRLSLNHLMSSWGIDIIEVTEPNHIADALQYAASEGLPFHMIIVGINRPDPQNEFIDDVIKLATTQYQCRVGVLVNTTEQTLYDKIQHSGAAICLPKPLRRKKLHDELVDTLISFTEKPKPLLTYQPAGQEDHSTTPVVKPLLSSNLHVLAVDDYPANLKLVATLLEDLGVKVDCATDGFEALELAKEQNYDLIFMDIQMPGIDGIEVTNRLRLREAPGQHTPIIALTAHALAVEREAVLSAGMDDYLTKPIDEFELERVLYRWAKKLASKSKDRVEIVSQAVTMNESVTVPVDWEKTLKLAGNKALLAKEMLKGLIEIIRPTQSNINQSYAKKDFKTMREDVHRLHGACCYCGVPALKAAASQLETAIVKKEEEMISFLMVEFNKEVNRLLQYVQNHQELLA
ncbi:MAG: two-component sensor histidine kinase BarA [Candidatus Berkiellales bacterium]